MKFHILKDGQPAGPYTKDEIQEKIYAGELPREVMACPEGGSTWVPLETVLHSNATNPPPLVPVPPVAPVNLDHLHDPSEKISLLWLYFAAVPMVLLLIFFTITSYGLLLLFIPLYWLFLSFGKLWFAAHLKTNSIRVSATQLPEVHRIVQASCQRLGMEEPAVYVIQQTVWNSFATKIFKQRMVVLFSGAVDSILLKGDHQQLAWLVGHELGHHWAGHLDTRQKIAHLGSWCIWINLWHSRRREFTCDRVGLYCAGSLAASQLALMNATVGAQLASRVNLAEATAQWQQHRGEFFVRYRTLYSTHPHLLARLQNLTNVAPELGLSR